jgi:hypothetical protein
MQRKIFQRCRSYHLGCKLRQVQIILEDLGLQRKVYDKFNTNIVQNTYIVGKCKKLKLSHIFNDNLLRGSIFKLF